MLVSQQYPTYIDPIPIKVLVPKINFLDHVLLYIFNFAFLITTLKTALQTTQKEGGWLFLETPAEKRKTIDPTGLLSETAEPRRLAFRPRKAKEVANHFL